jgi:lysine 6-dehydrogenase
LGCHGRRRRRRDGRSGGERYGATAATIDVSSGKGLIELLSLHEVVVSAVPYRLGYAVASAALATSTHYLDFGGNPTVVAAQKRMHADAHANGVMIVPDCGLAPGLANVLGEDLIASASPEPIDSIQIRVGALPQQPLGVLGYQLAFSPAGLINEYAEPCEVLIDGRHATIEPLSRFEDVAWPTWGPLEAFSTAGGTSTMCIRHEDRVSSLEYKTLRYPGHGRIFRALYEMGMFDETPHHVDALDVAPRAVLLEALNRNLPRDGDDIVPHPCVARPGWRPYDARGRRHGSRGFLGPRTNDGIPRDRARRPDHARGGVPSRGPDHERGGDRRGTAT